MFLLYVCVLQVLLLQNTECCSIKINCRENTTTTIRITIPISADGAIGDIQVEDDDLEAEGNNLEAEGDDFEAEGDDLEAEGEVDVDTVVPTVGEVIFEGPVRASGTVNIVGNFGPTLSADPLIPTLRTIPQLCTTYLPGCDFQQPTDVQEQCVDASINEDTPLKRLLRNLFLLNAAYQSNIPCEVVPTVPSNDIIDETENDENVENVGEIFAGLVPVSGKVTIIGTCL